MTDIYRDNDELREEVEQLKRTCDELRVCIASRDLLIEQIQLAKLEEGSSSKDPAWPIVKDRVPIGLLSRMSPSSIIKDVLDPLESAINSVRKVGFENESAKPIIQAIVKGL